MITSIIEVIHLIVASLVVGYIFSGVIKIPNKDVLTSLKRFNWEEFKIAVLAAAPGVIFHELGHKFVALAFGFKAVFEIWPTGMIIGIAMKVLNAPLMLIAPGYVSISGTSNPYLFSLTAFAGPFINLLFWIIPMLILDYSKKKYSEKTMMILLMTKEINKWMFLFNMIPIPPLDGSKVLYPLFGSLFG